MPPDSPPHLLPIILAMSTPKHERGDATGRHSSAPDPKVHTRRQDRPPVTQRTAMYFTQAHDFSIYGAEFNHIEGDQYISNHRHEDNPILLVRLFHEKQNKYSDNYSL